MATPFTALNRMHVMADSPENQLAALIDSGEYRPCIGALKVGVDLGTVNIAIVVVDKDNQPVAGGG